jgi:hypothetical protein
VDNWGDGDSSQLRSATEAATETGRSKRRAACTTWGGCDVRRVGAPNPGPKPASTSAVQSRAKRSQRTSHDHRRGFTLPREMRANGPLPSSSVGRVVTVGEAYGTEGREFESLRARYKIPGKRRAFSLAALWVAMTLGTPGVASSPVRKVSSLAVR